MKCEASVHSMIAQTHEDSLCCFTAVYVTLSVFIDIIHYKLSSFVKTVMMKLKEPFRVF